ncbi:MAG: tyrosine-type recombinase/integrase [Bacteroidales bacterium]
MGVKLREKTNKNGTKSLFLDIIANGKRYKEYLGITLKLPRTPEERQVYKESKELAETIRAKKQLELQAGEHGITPKYKGKVDFVEYFTRYVENYPHKDYRRMKGALVWFERFMAAQNIKAITAKQLNENHCKGFMEYLKTYLKGETPYNYFSKFRMVVRQAIKDKLIVENPTENVKAVRDGGLKKETLSLKEIETLAKAHCPNTEVKRAFLFSLYSGLRWVDVKELTYSNIDFTNGSLSFVQSKTKNTSRNSRVIMALSPMLVRLIGEPKERKAKIFALPSHTGALKSLKKWVENAGITKNITWHCARHSFAVNLLSESKADVKTVASLLGHSGLKHIEVYTRAIDEKKAQAINSLPTIEF